MSERVDDLPEPLAPERVAERMEHLGAPHTESVARFNGGFGAAFEHLAAVPLDVLRGTEVDASEGNEHRMRPRTS